MTSGGTSLLGGLQRRSGSARIQRGFQQGRSATELGTGHLEADAKPSALERALGSLTRRQLLRRGAGALGGLAGLGLLDAGSVLARATGRPGLRPSGAPRPIPGGFDANFNLVPTDPLIHVLPPGIGFEMSTITDFNGVVGAAEIRGTARGSDGTSYDFDADMRFMRGVFVGLDGRHHEGSFGFI